MPKVRLALRRLIDVRIVPLAMTLLAAGAIAAGSVAHSSQSAPETEAIAESEGVGGVPSSLLTPDLVTATAMPSTALRPRIDAPADPADALARMGGPLLTPSLTPPPTTTLPVPWIGLNNWALAASSDVHDDCGGASELLLDTKMARWQAAGVDVVRFAAFQSFAIDATHSRNWIAFDRVFASAQAHNIHLIPVLGNNWQDCDYWTYPGRQGKDVGTPLACGGSGNWYDTGYKQPYNGYVTGYRQWVQDFTSRYAGHPMLAAWELVNEPWESCIHDFFVDVIGVVKAADPVTPVSLGSGGGGEAWTANGGYARETALADWATAHIYTDSDTPLVEKQDCGGASCLGSDLRDAALLRKPFYVGEGGVWDSADCDSQRRADQYRWKIASAFAGGASGYLVWAYNEQAPRGQCGLDFGPDSPIMRVFSEF